MTEQDLLSKKILIVVAHPDDESFIAGGTLAKNVKLGGSNFLYCATLGEKGRAHLDAEYSEEELKKKRQGELVEAMAVLGIREFKVGLYPDGGLAEYVTMLVDDIRTLVQKWNPDVIIGFGLDGYTGHKDHIAIYRAGSQVASELGVPYYASTLPSDDRGIELKGHLIKKRACDTYDDTETVAGSIETIEIDGDTKLQALQCYTSQWNGLNPHKIFPVDIAREFLSHEHFLKIC